MKTWKYRVKFCRTAKWYPNDWRTLSNWCDARMESKDWDYTGGHFTFLYEADALAFKLKFGENSKEWAHLYLK